MHRRLESMLHWHLAAACVLAVLECRSWWNSAAGILVVAQLMQLQLPRWHGLFVIVRWHLIVAAVLSAWYCS